MRGSNRLNSNFGPGNIRPGVPCGQPQMMGRPHLGGNMLALQQQQLLQQQQQFLAQQEIIQMEQLRKQRLLRQQQEQQQAGLTAAIRELQQKTLQQQQQQRALLQNKIHHFQPQQQHFVPPQKSPSQSQLRPPLGNTSTSNRLFTPQGHDVRPGNSIPRPFLGNPSFAPGMLNTVGGMNNQLGLKPNSGASPHLITTQSLPTTLSQGQCPLSTSGGVMGQRPSINIATATSGSNLNSIHLGFNAGQPPGFSRRGNTNPTERTSNFIEASAGSRNHATNTNTSRSRQPFSGPRSARSNRSMQSPLGNGGERSISLSTPHHTQTESSERNSTQSLVEEHFIEPQQHRGERRRTSPSRNRSSRPRDDRFKRGGERTPERMGLSPGGGRQSGDRVRSRDSSRDGSRSSSKSSDSPRSRTVGDRGEGRDAHRSRSSTQYASSDRGTRWSRERSVRSRDSSVTRDENLKRRRSPSVSSEIDNSSVSSGLSQYRQDLLRSEAGQSDGENGPPSRKRAKLDLQDGDSLLGASSGAEEEIEDPLTTSCYVRSCPADLYFRKNPETRNMEASAKMVELENKFEEEIVNRAEKVRATQVKVEDPPLHPPIHHHHHHHHCTGHESSSSCDSSSDEEADNDDDDEGSGSQIMEEWDRRKKHPYSLHKELWFNLRGQANDGPLCRCSIKSRQSGLRHDIYPGEKPIQHCTEESNNLDHLFHYRVTMSPYTNFLTKEPTVIMHDDHEYIFEGFSMFSHAKLENIPPCKLLRFNIEYTLHFIPESAPENFSIRSLNLFKRFIFHEILELIDINWMGQGDSCNRFHFMPRFCRTLPDSGCKEVLSMNTVLNFLLRSARPLVEESKVEEIMTCGDSEWHSIVDSLRGMIVTNPGMKPSSIRIDQLDRKVTTPVMTKENMDDSEEEKESKDKSSGQESQAPTDHPRYPLIIHQGFRPAQLSYAGDPVYRKAWKQYVKFRHLLNSKPKIFAADKVRLKEQEEKLREIRMKKTMKREVTIEVSSKGFLCTGLRADLCQHALMIPVLMSHLRFHICLDMLEETLEYKFQDRNLLQLSLTHTSYRTNYGTNPDHTRNSLTNCGMRQVEYGDRRIHYQNTRKRGICILVDIMSRLGKQEETVSEIPHNERLEFLGDAVIEFLTSVHLFYMFPWLDEGGLTTYRMALVQNQHLAVLARKLKLQDFMLYVHGPDLCHESDLRHAMANCCEAIMGALFLDGGLEVVDRIFSKTLFDEEDVLLHTWNDLPQHALQQEEPGGDRHWVKSSPILQKLEKFEESIGVKFTHIRLLAKAFTHRNIGVNPLTLGHNQRLEFLGDTVLQLIASEYLYKHYPEHHEGHLSLLRSSLVNSRTQGLVYDDLGMADYVIFNENAVTDARDMKTKQRADILESFVGALFVDKDLDFCRTFCNVCFFPRLKDFIMNQDWNDPKSQLQQCCLTLREVGGGEPDIPVYKVIESIGPTNTRKYVVAVYFRGKRLARGTGHSIQQAEMAAATQAMKKREELFPILQHQRRFLERMRSDVGKSSDERLTEKQEQMKSSRPGRRRRQEMRKKQDKMGQENGKR